mgnify:CR=1 FL=1
MDWNKLKSFYEVAIYKSISKASAKLNISQSALSRQIQDLEVDLKPPLFIRHIQDVKSNSFTNNSLKSSDKLYPLVIFSHGLGGNRTQNSINIESLASNGYVVFSIERSYDANVTVFDDSTFVEFDSYLYSIFQYQ